MNEGLIGKLKYEVEKQKVNPKGVKFETVIKLKKVKSIRKGVVL